MSACQECLLDKFPLTCSAFLGHLACMDFLISNGADVNEMNDHGNQALIYVSYKGYLDCIQLLISNDADISQKNSQGYTALDYAYLGKQSDSIGFLRNLNENGQDLGPKFANKLY